MQKKTQTLIYGDDDKALKEAAVQIRAADIHAHVGLRSARLFTPGQAEAADKVIILGDHPHVAAGYKDHPNVLTGEKAATAPDAPKKSGKKAATAPEA